MSITFGDTDPYYRQRQLDRVAESGAMFVNLVQQRRAREEQKRQAELARAYQMIERYPEVVDAPEGQRLAEQFPEIAPYLNVVRNRGQVRREIDSAGEAWLSEADRLRGEHEESLKRQALLASAVTPFGMPNTQAFGRLAQEAQVHPDTFLQRSAEGMSPSERVAANLWAKERGLRAPEPQYQRRFDPTKDLDQTTRGVYFADQLPPEAGRAARVGANIEEGAREQVRRDLDTSRNERAGVAAENARRGLDLRERGLSLRERGGGAGGGRTPAVQYQELRSVASGTDTAYQDRAKERQKAWDAERRSREENLEDVDDLGPRPAVPPKILPGEINRMTRRAAEIGGSVPEQEAMVEAMVAQYHQLVSDGAKPREATRRALEMSAPPTPPDFGNVQSGVSGSAVPQGAPQQSGAPPAQPTREQLVESTRGIVEQAAQRGITVDERDVELMVRDLAAGATPEQVLQQLLRGAGG